MQFKTENSRPKFLTMALLWSDGCYFCMGMCVWMRSWSQEWWDRDVTDFTETDFNVCI